MYVHDAREVSAMLLCLLIGLCALFLTIVILGLMLGWFRPRGAHANFDQGFSATAIARLAEAPRRTTAPQARAGLPGDEMRTDSCA